MKNLILSAGGDIHETTIVDWFWVSLLPKNPKVLYIPIAWENGNYEDCLRWFSGLMTKYGIGDYAMWTELADKIFDDLDAFDSVYIGGGNTFKLLHVFRESGFIDLLRRYIRTGKPVFGGSAGAIILGANIGLAALGENSDVNDVGISDLSGLDEVDGYAVQCHYAPDQDDEIADWCAAKAFSAVSLAEASGIYVTDEGISSIGSEARFF